MGYYLGVDIGGTFTDCVAVDETGDVFHAKVPSTHGSSPVLGVMDGLVQLAREVGVEADVLLASAERLSHGTTIGTNLLVERNGARVGLLATAGHGDALAMMRGNGRTAGVPPDQVFSVHATDKPAPLVDPSCVVEIAERVAGDGEIIAELDEARARAAIRSMLEDGEVDAIAIALLWSFRNPKHERRLREIARELAPDVFVSLSCETAPRQGEYERTVATVLNCYVGPASSRYLEELDAALRARGLRVAPFIMQSNGGVVPVGVAREFPVQTIGSGPAGGLAGTAQLAAVNGHANVIATDMGGTSFDVGLIIEGRPLLSSQQVVEQYTFHLPQLDLRSIACGGGSIASVDHHSGALRVGPRSAGSDPGPACYGKGLEPTVTDADVVLGLIDPDGFLAGRMPLDRVAAERAVRSVAEVLGLSVEEAAAGIVHVNNQAAALLIRRRTLEQGLDPRDFVLYAFGGAGPVHAFGFAQALGVSEVVVPLGNGASSLSAFGIAATDVARTFEQQCSLFAPFDSRALAGVIGDVEDRAGATMRMPGFDADDVVFERVAAMRYAEQFLHDLPIALPSGAIDDRACARLAERFDDEYARLYGEGARSLFQAVELFGVRVSARVPLGFVPLAHAEHGANGGRRTVTGDKSRQVYWPEEHAWGQTAVHDGRRLRSGDTLCGPALVELPHTTVAVAGGQQLTVESAHNLVLHLG
jgi:N-methylhydantoinase A